MQKREFEFHDLPDNRLPIIYQHYSIGRNDFVPVNWHDNVELLYITAGEGTVLCSGIAYPVRKDDLIVVNSNELHHVSCEDSLSYHLMIVDTDFLLWNDLPVKGLDFGVTVSSEETKALFLEILKELDTAQDFSSAGVRAQVLRLMVYLCRYHATQSTDCRTDADENIKLAIGYIRSNYSRKLSLEEIATQVGLSKFHFSRQFKAATGMTVTAFINGIRCRNAKKMLLQKKYPVNQVAVMCGFENNSYFAKTFQKIMGCLPSEVVQ